MSKIIFSPHFINELWLINTQSHDNPNSKIKQGVYNSNYSSNDCGYYNCCYKGLQMITPLGKQQKAPGTPEAFISKLVA
ncbi:hypothetical protein [Mucilaginibacter gracilis]|uniref:hypothetical protein n=1 Tax=Mucilaginibacter gracilis TaxID=423350 RepID=UPI000EB580F7|nr:hypothetical protein [Mucilaginibacter gracilis]